MFFAFALALALHEILAGFLPPSHPGAAPQIHIAKIDVERPRPTPAPTPQPTPTPKPRPRLTPRPRATPPPHARRLPRLLHSAPKRAGRIAHRHGGKAAPHHPIPPRVVPHVVATTAPQSLASGIARGVQNGGTGTGAGIGRGAGGNAGTSAVAGTGGNGNADADGAPCGDVTFVKVRERHLRDGRVVIDVGIRVALRGGETVEDQLGWPFVYPSDAAVPFSHPDLPMLMQFPPPGYELEKRQKPAVVTAVRETAENGLTHLRDCSDTATP